MIRFDGRPILALFVLLTGCGGSVDPILYSKFQSAQSAFDEAQSTDDFLRTAAMYQEILNSGVVSGAVLYNQGNAFMRASQKGRAVACYRQAQRYRPRDPYLNANLANALGGSDAQRSRPLVEYVLFWQDAISYSSKFTLSTIFAIATFIIAVTSLFVWAAGLKRCALAALLITLALVVSVGYDWYRFTHIKHGVTVADQVVARKGDGESYQPAFTDPLNEATEFVVIDHRSGWVLARFSGAQEGWLPEKDIVSY